MSASADPGNTNPASYETLQQQIAARDKIINNLQKRLEALEQKVGAVTPAPEAPVTTAAAAPAAASSVSSNSAAQVTAAAAAEEEPAAEEETIRALERTLVRQGGLVVPLKSYEIEPRFSYDHSSSNMLAITDDNGQPVIARQDLKRDAFEAGVGVRIGLPWETQFEAYAPYGYTRVQQADLGLNDNTDRNSGIGNIELGITKQFLHDNGTVPALLGSLRWRNGSSSNSDNTLTGVGSSFDSTQVALTAVKRLDPLVFVGSVSYTANQSKSINGQRIEPGDMVGMSLSSILAVSPSTSLSMGLNIARSGEFEINGTKAPGSDVSLAVLDLGYSFLLSPRTLLSVNAGIGLTENSPDYTLGVSLPVRFQF